MRTRALPCPIRQCTWLEFSTESGKSSDLLHSMRLLQRRARQHCWLSARGRDHGYRRARCSKHDLAPMRFASRVRPRKPGSGDTYYVLTNNHVVDGATDISVRLYDQRVFRAKVTMVSGRAGDAMMLEHSSQITRFQRRRYCRRAERYMCWSGWRRRCACAATIIPMIPKAILLSSESDASPVSVAACENTIPAKNPPAPVTPANCTSVVVRLVSEVRPTIIKPLATANHFRPAKSFRSNPDAKVPTARQRNAKARNRPLPVLDPPSFTA